ncbi:MAG: nucleotidyltransferase domain-containing protein [Candidatus Nanoarchaeia archaeon]
MLNKLQTKIVSHFLRQPFEKYTMNELAKALGRYHSEVRRALHKLKALDVINIEKIGSRTSECSINLSADTDLLVYGSLENKSRVPKNIKAVTRELEKNLYEHLYILVLFGSYAKGNAGYKSDIDLCFIGEDTDKFKSKVHGLLQGFSYNIDVNIFSPEEFYNMLWKRDTVGREILNSSIVLHGHDLYYTLVKMYDRQAGNSKISNTL